MTMQRLTKADKQQTTAHAKASKSYTAKSGKSTKKASLSHSLSHSLSYSTNDDDKLIFVDDDVDPNSSDSTDDDPLVFIDDDVTPNVSTDTTDDDPLIFVDDDVNPKTSSPEDDDTLIFVVDDVVPTAETATEINGGGSSNTLTILPMDDKNPSPPSPIYLNLSVADSTAIKAKESLSQPPLGVLDNHDAAVAKSNTGVIGVGLVAAVIIVFTVKRARNRYYYREHQQCRRGEEEVGNDLEEAAAAGSGSDVSSVWSGADLTEL